MVQFLIDDRMPHFTIPGTFPSLNEYLGACARNPKAGGAMKRKYMNIAVEAIRFSTAYRFRPKRAIVVHFVYYEPNRRRDKDNIDSMCRKCVFDALQKCGVIQNDGWSEIENYTHDFYVADNPKNVRVEVYLEEV